MEAYIISITKQTLTFVPKLVAVMLALAVFGPWTMAQLVNFCQHLLDSFPTYVK